MRRHKRDMAERAFSKGYQAGISGRSKDSCPTNHIVMRQEWLNGWREGRTDNWDGFTGVSGIQKQAKLLYS